MGQTGALLYGDPLHSAITFGYINTTSLLAARMIKAGSDLVVANKSGNTPLHLAARTGHVDIITLLVAGMPEGEINCTNCLGDTPLHEAAKSNQPEAVSVLINLGADLEAKNKHDTSLNLFSHSVGIGRRTRDYAHYPYAKDTVTFSNNSAPSIPSIARPCEGWQPIHFAAESGNVPMIKIFLTKKPALLNAQTAINKWTPLLIAASNGKIEVFNFLLSKGARVDLCNKDGFSALHFAIIGFFEKDTLLAAFDALIAAGIDIGTKGFTPLLFACQQNNEVAIRKLLEHNAPVNVKDSTSCTPLDASIRNRECSREIFDLLLSKGATTGNDTRSMLHDVLYYGNPHAIEIFLKNYQHEINKKDKHGQTLLNAAIAGWAPLKSVEALLDAGGEIGDENSTPLHFSCDCRSPEAVKLLIRKHPGDINKVDSKGLSPLNVAIKSRALGDVINPLLDAGGKVKKGLGPVHYACECDNLPAVKILIERYKTIDTYVGIKNGFSFCHLDSAVDVDSDRIIKWLIEEKGANVDNTDGNGWTPLHLAAQDGKFEAVKALVECDATIEMQTENSDENAIKIAKRKKHTRIAEYLKQKLEN